MTVLPQYDLTPLSSDHGVEPPFLVDEPVEDAPLESSLRAASSTPVPKQSEPADAEKLALLDFHE